MGTVEPIDLIERRLVKAGRIRMGMTVTGTRRDGSTYTRPTRSDTWILTSSRPDNLERLAQDYGGTVEEWTDGNADRSEDTHILVTETNRLEVRLPRDAMTPPRYELWEGGQRRRVCDGVTVVGFPRGQPGMPPPEPVERPCLCNEEGAEVKCRPKVRLSLLLPQVQVGAWRLDTSSDNALRELQASIEVIRLAEAQGLLPLAELRIDKRKSGEKEYSVPVLTSYASLNELMTGAPMAPRFEVSPPPSAVAALEAGDEIL